MPFVRMPGLTGKVYVPEDPPGQKKKHGCPDCYACQKCSDDRCQICRGGTPKSHKIDRERGQGGDDTA